MERTNERIRRLRQEAGLSQLELGSRVGRTQGSITSYENGQIPPYKIIEKLAKVLDVSVSYLMCLTEDRHGSAVPTPVDVVMAQHPELTRNEALLLAYYRDCSQLWKDNLMMDARSAAGQTRRDAEAATAASSVRSA